MLDNLRYEDIETAALIIFLTIFILVEKFWPKNRNLDIKSVVKWDILCFFVLVASVNISRLVVTQIYNGMNIKSLGVMEATAQLPFLVRMLMAFLISDLWLYWLHRGMHNNAFLWRTHQLHHTPETMYAFAGFRTSFMHALLYAFPQVLVAFYLFQFTQLELGIAFGLGVLSNLFTHSNISVPKWLPLHHIFVTPEFHHPHHSQLGTQNKNFGNVFTIWDRMFGSYVDPSKIRSDFKYGLKEKAHKWRSLIGL